jgi:hypothetical protein
MNATHAMLNATWTPASPLTATMQMVVLACEGDATIRCNNQTLLSEWVRGPPPLAMDLPLEPLEPTKRAFVYLRPTRLLPDPVVLWASTEQPFRIEGLVWSDPHEE